MEQLLQHGADPTIRSRDAKTAFSLAVGKSTKQEHKKRIKRRKWFPQCCSVEEGKKRDEDFDWIKIALKMPSHWLRVGSKKKREQECRRT